MKCFFSYNGSMKILFLDIDGTVLSHTTNTIPSSALKAINTVRKQGIKVFGCTGRHTLELEKLPLEHLEVDGWITMNGAYNYTESCLISSYPIEKQDIHALYDFLKKESFPVQFLEAKYMYMNMHSSLVEKSLEKIHKSNGVSCFLIPPQCCMRNTRQTRIFSFSSTVHLQTDSINNMSISV